LHISVSGGEGRSEGASPVDLKEFQERREEMETKPETTKGKMQLKDYVRWFFVGAFGLLILLTVIMAVYRKYGG
jgi:hypothetical protein